jgi:hypothetical protein
MKVYMRDRREKRGKVKPIGSPSHTPPLCSLQLSSIPFHLFIPLLRSLPAFQIPKNVEI